MHNIANGPSEQGREEGEIGFITSFNKKLLLINLILLTVYECVFLATHKCHWHQGKKVATH